MNQTFLLSRLQEIFQKPIVRIEELPLGENNSITGKISMKNSSIYQFLVYFDQGEPLNIICKYKSNKIILNGIVLLNSDRDLKLYYLLYRYRKVLGFNKSYLRESIFYQKISGPLQKNLIQTWGFYQNIRKNQYLIVMSKAKNTQVFTTSMIYDILDAILCFHIQFYNDESCIDKYHLNHYTSKEYAQSRSLFRYIFEKLKEDNKKFFDTEAVECLHGFIENIHILHEKLPTHKSLTHNDFTMRNIFYAEQRPVIYDWELACFQNPEHDLMEFLIFILHRLTDEEVLEIIHYYKKALFHSLSLNIPNAEYKKILQFNTMEFCINKLSLYRLANRTLKLDFMEQICNNSNRILQILRRKKVLYE